MAIQAGRFAECSDEDRELGRSYRRTVFYGRDWREYRSILRYRRNMDGILTSRIARGLLQPIFYVFVSSCAVCYYETLLSQGLLVRILPDMPWPELAVSPSGPFSISTFALSLLLVFRTNSSYHRWWEACGVWNSVVVACCQLGRQALQRLPNVTKQDGLIRAALLRWLRAFPLALMCYVREDEDKMEGLMEGVLLPQERQLLVEAPVRPQTVIQVIGSLVGRTDLPPESKARMDENVKALQVALLACEKLIRTPLPLSYSRHTARFLITWLTFLPFCSWKVLGWATVPVDVIMGFFLLGIEEIGVQVEEPLSLLALEHWTSLVDERITQMELQHDAIEALDLAPPTGQGLLEPRQQEQQQGQQQQETWPTAQPAKNSSAHGLQQRWSHASMADRQVLGEGLEQCAEEVDVGTILSDILGKEELGGRTLGKQSGAGDYRQR